jgi:CRISPR/Cas system-associated endoribonuclease Cas2
MKDKQWFLLIFDLEKKKNKERVQIFRKLAVSNILKLQHSVYAVGVSYENESRIKEIAQALKEFGADVLLFEGTLRDIGVGKTSSQQDLERMAGESLDGKYSQLIEELRGFKDKIKKAETGREKRRVLEQILNLSKRFVALSSLDPREVMSTKRSLLESELFDAKELMKSIAEEK